MADICFVIGCPICLGPFQDPRVLPCGHTFCLDCIRQHGRSKGFFPDCPNCRTWFHIPLNGFEALPKNYCLNRVLEESSSAAESSRTNVMRKRCKKHSDEELVLYCLQCDVVICLDCLEDDHRKHDYSKIGRFAKVARTLLDGYVKGIKPILSLVTSQKSKVEEESQKLFNLLDKSELAINDECENMIQLINENRRLLLEELSTEKQRITEALKMKTDEIETEHLRLTSFITQAEETLQKTGEAMTFDMVIKYKDLKDDFDKLNQTQPAADMGHVNIAGIEFIPGYFRDWFSRRGTLAIGRLQKECDAKSKVERNEVLRRDLALNWMDTSCSSRLVTSNVRSNDQYNLEEQTMATEHVGIGMIFDSNGTYRIEADWLNVDKAIDRLLELRLKKSSGKNMAPISRYGAAPELEVESNQEVWYYLKRKHQDKSDHIAGQNFCVMRVAYGVSNNAVSRNSCEFVPYTPNNPDDQFNYFYEKISKSGIVKEGVKFPVSRNQMECKRLIADLEEMGVYWLRSDSCLVGPGTCIEEAKQKVSDLASGRSSSSAQTQPDDNIGVGGSVEPLKIEIFSGLAVYVTKGDLLRQSVDAIVIPANEYASSNGGGGAFAVAKAILGSRCSEYDDYMRQYEKLGSARVMHTSAGNLRPRINYVIHTVVPWKSDAIDDEELTEFVRVTVLNCLRYANDELKVRSVAIPAIGSGIFGVPIEIVSKALFQALSLFSTCCSSFKTRSLHEIYILNGDEDNFSSMKRIFQSSPSGPEYALHTMELLDQHADACGLRRIETTQRTNCFARALATAFQEEFQSTLDWSKVVEMIRKELCNNRNLYNEFRTETGKQWSFADDRLCSYPFADVCSPMNGDEGCESCEACLYAAADALQVKIFLLYVPEEHFSFHKEFQPSPGVNWSKTVCIGYHFCGCHRYDALVKKAN